MNTRTTMPGKQKDITQFFSPKPKINAEIKDDLKGGDETPEKKRKQVDEEHESTPDNNSCLSPEQKKRMLSSKIVAKIKVTSKSFPFALHSNIGPTWFSALENEFSKPYFQKLNEFLEMERRSTTKIFPPEDEVLILKA